MWLIMRGALSEKVRKVHQSYYLPSMTPIATVIYENTPDGPPSESDVEYRARIGRESGTNGLESRNSRERIRSH